MQKMDNCGPSCPLPRVSADLTSLFATDEARLPNAKVLSGSSQGHAWLLYVVDCLDHCFSSMATESCLRQQSSKISASRISNVPGPMLPLHPNFMSSLIKRCHCFIQQIFIGCPGEPVGLHLNFSPSIEQLCVFS